MITIGYLLFMTSIFAALLAFHAAVSRYQFALGRERMLPSRWGYTHPRTGAPVVGSVTQSVLSLIAILAYWFTQADPLVQLFGYLTVVGGLGGLLVGAGGAALLARFVPAMQAYTAPAVVAAALAMAFGVGLLAGVIPALRAARLDPIEALRAE